MLTRSTCRSQRLGLPARTRGRRGPTLCLLLVAAVTPAVAANFHVDCDSGDDGAPGTTPQTAWQSLARASAQVYAPGDAILLRRGTRCPGALRPAGSGSAAQPIVAGAYGEGARPVIEAGTASAAIRLFNQQYWEIRDLETTGGDPFGIHISGDIDGTLTHFRIVDTEVHDVGGQVTNKESGLIVITPGAAETTFDDVVIDGAVAHDTTQWAGILVGGDDFGGTPDSPRSTHVIIRNSTVHHVYGDGIVLYQVDHGLIETSVVHDTGLNPSTAVGTPNGIWTWMCGDCVVQLNEGYRTHSPGVDGGVYDIDYGCSDNIVQYNFAHDAAAYCVSIFAAYGPTTNSVVRYNVCANNGRDATKAYQGDIYMVTWAGGWIDGVRVYNNTLVWDPVVDAYAVNLEAAVFSGPQAREFKNNLVSSSVPELVKIGAGSGLEFDHNLYWYDGEDAPRWSVDAAVSPVLQDWQALGHDPHGLYADPLLADRRQERGDLSPTAFALRLRSPAIDAGTSAPQMGQRDYAGVPVPLGLGRDIGALESRPGPRPAYLGTTRRRSERFVQRE